MDENDLQINITAVDEASGTLDNVAAAAEGMATAIDEAATVIAESLDGAFTASEEAAIAAAELAAEAWGGAANSVVDDFEQIETPISEVFNALVEVNAEAAAKVAAAWAEEGQAMEDSLATALSAVGEEFAGADAALVEGATTAGEAAGTAAAEGFGGYFKKLIVGYALEQIGTFLSGGIAAAIAAQAAPGNQIKDVTDQISVAQAALEKLQQPISGKGKTSGELGADEADQSAKITAAKQHIQELQQQLATLTAAQQGLPGQITKIEGASLAWLEQNKPLEDSLQTLSTTLGPLLKIIGEATIVFTILGVMLSVLDTPMLIIIAIAVAVSALYAIWKTFHTEIVNFFNDLNTKTGIIDLFKQSWEDISKNFQDNLMPALGKLWDALQPLEPFMKAFAIVIGASLLGAIVLVTDALTIAINLFTDLLTIATKVATFFTNVFVGALHLVEGAIEAIVTAVQKIGSVGGAIGGAISSTLSKIPAFAEGGIVNGPTLALVGEAGPEAIIPLSAFNGGGSLAGGGSQGGGGNVIVNITGTFLSRDAARQIGDMLAVGVNRQTKMRSFS